MLATRDPLIVFAEALPLMAQYPGYYTLTIETEDGRRSAYVASEYAMAQLKGHFPALDKALGEEARPAGRPGSRRRTSSEMSVARMQRLLRGLEHTGKRVVAVRVKVGATEFDLAGGDQPNIKNDLDRELREFETRDQG